MTHLLSTVTRCHSRPINLAARRRLTFTDPTVNHPHRSNQLLRQFLALNIQTQTHLMVSSYDGKLESSNK